MLKFWENAFSVHEQGFKDSIWLFQLYDTELYS